MAPRAAALALLAALLAAAAPAPARGAADCSALPGCTDCSYELNKQGTAAVLTCTRCASPGYALKAGKNRCGAGARRGRGRTLAMRGGGACEGLRELFMTGACSGASGPAVAAASTPHRTAISASACTFTYTPQTALPGTTAACPTAPPCAPACPRLPARSPRRVRSALRPTSCARAATTARPRTAAALACASRATMRSWAGRWVRVRQGRAGAH